MSSPAAAVLAPQSELAAKPIEGYHPVRSLFGVASSWYQRLTPYAPAMLLKGVEKVQSISEPIVTKYGVPLVDKLDGVVNGAADRVSRSAATVVAVKTTIANDLKERRVPYLAESKAMVSHLGESFHTAVVFHVIADSLNQVVASGRKLEVPEFINGLKGRLGKLWDDSLVGPLTASLHSAKTNLQALADASRKRADRAMEGLKSQVPKEWVEQASKVFETASKGSVNVFNDILAELGRIRANGVICEAEEFVKMIEARVVARGGKFEERLRPMVKKMYESFLAMPAAAFNAAALHDLLDVDKDRALTVRDFVRAGSHLATVTTEAVTNKWQGMLQTGMNLVDRVLPASDKEIKPKEESDVKVLTVRAVAGAVQFRLYARVTQSMQTLRDTLANQVATVRRVGAERVKAVIRIDVYAVAEASYTKAKNQVVEWKEKASEKLQLKKHLEQLNEAAKSVRARAQAAAQNVRERATHVSTFVHEKAIQPFQARVVEPLRTQFTRVRSYALDAYNVVIVHYDQKVVARAAPHIKALREKMDARVTQLKEKAKQVREKIHAGVEKIEARWHDLLNYLLDTPIINWVAMPREFVVTAYTRMKDGSMKLVTYAVQLSHRLPFVHVTEVAKIEQPPAKPAEEKKENEKN